MSPIDILIFIGIVAIGFFIAGVLAPFEALGWWAGWYGHTPRYQEVDISPVKTSTKVKHYVVFLSGIHNVSGQTFAEREIAFLAKLKVNLQDSKLVDDIFPYSVTEQPLTGQRFFAWFWRWAFQRKLQGPGLAGFLINIRNFWQVAVSADSRYGPIYNQGAAEIILHGLLRHGYLPQSGLPVILIGYSGGGQIAIGAAPYLKAAIEAPISVISLGGVMSADSGILALDRLYHLFGDKDGVQRLSSIFFPGRWPIFPYSGWNQAKAKGIIAFVPLGPPKHTGSGGYLDQEAFLSDGRTYLDNTVTVIARLVKQAF